jgi:hypothetical protein
MSKIQFFFKILFCFFQYLFKLNAVILVFMDGIKVQREIPQGFRIKIFPHIHRYENVDGTSRQSFSISGF